MSTREKPQEPDESLNTAFREPKEEVCEEQQRRGQFVVNMDNAEPPGRGRYIAGAENTETPEEIESIEGDSSTP